MFIAGPMIRTWKRSHFDFDRIFVGLAGALVLDRLACHFHEAAERDGADAVVGAAAGETEQSRPEPNRERQHPDANASGGEVVAQLVDENEHANDKSESKERRHERRSLTLSILSSKPGGPHGRAPGGPTPARLPAYRPFAHRVPTRVASMMRAMAGNASRPARKASTAISLAALSATIAVPPWRSAR